MVGNMVGGTYQVLPSGLKLVESCAKENSCVYEFCRMGRRTMLLCAPLKLDTEDKVYLGVIEQMQGDRLWVTIEHMIDRRVLSSIQTTWKEAGPVY